MPSMPMLMQSDSGKSSSAVIWSRCRVVETCSAAGCWIRVSSSKPQSLK